MSQVSGAMICGVVTGTVVSIGTPFSSSSVGLSTEVHDEARVSEVVSRTSGIRGREHPLFEGMCAVEWRTTFLSMATASRTDRIERTRAAIERVCSTSDSADALLEGLSAEMHRAVPHVGSTWFGVDPATMLATAPSRIEYQEAGLCDTFWHLEFHEHDTAQFADLARGTGAAALRLTLDDRLTRSIRYREFMQPQGYEDELRAVFQTGTNTWGVVGLYRDSAATPF